MRVPLSWLREYVDINIPVEELAERLTLAGLEVSSIEKIGETWSREHVFVGRIISVSPHPNADRLSLPLVDYGGPEPIQVVTGAPNIKVGDSGQKVVVALSGAKLIDGHSEEKRWMVLKPGTIRGVPSSAMVCSEKELSLSDEHEGIIILPDDAPVGMPLIDYMGDTVIEVDITPNLARCLSIIGVAREVAALTGMPLKLKEPEMLETGAEAADQVTVRIADPDLCARYSAVVVRNIKIGPSPLWMQRRLQLCDVRPQNNIVDITNYVMIEWGQPLHAFDYDILHDETGATPPQAKPLINVRRAAPGEKMTTLDGVERRLDSDVLLITDGAGPVAVAGVMGGLHSEIENSTCHVLLESASFDNIGNRISAQRLKMSSEASMRFGRGVPPSLTIPAARRAAELMRLLAGGEVQRGIVDCYPRPQETVVLSFRPEHARKLLGLHLTDTEIERILSSEGFEIVKGEACWQVTVPDHRLDIGIEEDLCEEIARIYGYDRMPSTLLRDELPPAHDDSLRRAEESLRDGMVRCGLQEAITYAMTDVRLEKMLRGESAPQESEYVRILNPLTAERQWLRRCLLPELLICARDNFRHEETVSIFEIGQVFLPIADEQLPEEQPRLAFVIGGADRDQSWLDKGKEPAMLDYFSGKGVLEEISRWLGVSLQFQPTQKPELHPGRAAAVILAGTGEIGYLGELHPSVRAAFELPEVRICVCELNIEAMLAGWAKWHKVRPVSRYPSVVQDMALLVPDQVSAAQVQELIEQTGKGLLASVSLFDVYSGDPIPAGYRNLAYRLVYQSVERTPSEDEVKKTHHRIAKRLEIQLGATIRS